MSAAPRSHLAARAGRRPRAVLVAGLLAQPVGRGAVLLRLAAHADALAPHPRRNAGLVRRAARVAHAVAAAAARGKLTAAVLHPEAWLRWRLPRARAPPRRQLRSAEPLLLLRLRLAGLRRERSGRRQGRPAAWRAMPARRAAALPLPRLLLCPTHALVWQHLCHARQEPWRRLGLPTRPASRVRRAPLPLPSPR